MATATKERPILFSGPMVRAILEGRKTQTRRIVKLSDDWFDHCDVVNPDIWWRFSGSIDGGTQCEDLQCPYGRPGDRLWVRETWQLFNDGLDANEDFRAVLYRSGGTAQWRDLPYAVEKRANGLSAEYSEPKTWRSPIQMPRWASRIDLEITGLRVERLQDISTYDAEAEGVNPFDFDDCRTGSETQYQACFRKRWHELNGADSWAANPWVWVIEFKRVDQ